MRFEANMKVINYVLGLCVLSWTTSAWADPCARIHDPDVRSMCRAETTGDESHCSLIKDHDKREYCRAKVKKM